MLERARSVAAVYRKAGLWGTLKAVWGHLVGAELTASTVNELTIATEALNLTAERGVMIDVGAHHGRTSAPFCRAGWRVLAFEPDAENRAILTEYLRDFDNVSIDSRAVSDREQAAVAFFRSDQSSGISGLSSFHESHEQSGTVETTTLSKVMNEYEIGHVDVLKIDTEGFDKLVLDGFPWDKDMPRVVICEFEDRKTLPLGYSYTDLVGLLEAKGFKVIVSEWKPIVAYGGQHEWSKYHVAPHALGDERAWGNLVALRESDDFDRVRTRFNEVADILARSRA